MNIATINKLDKIAKLQKDINLIVQCLEERWIPAKYGIIAFDDTSCALCEEYTENNCYAANGKNRCPIAERTKQRSCRGTPYYRCTDNYTYTQLMTKMKLPLFQVEIDFLMDLKEELKTKYNNECEKRAQYDKHDKHNK